LSEYIDLCTWAHC